MIPIFGLYVLVKWLFTKILSKYGDNCLTRRVRANIEFTVVTLRYLLEGCIQIGMSAMICVLSVSIAFIHNVNLCNLSVSDRKGKL